MKKSTNDDWLVRLSMPSKQTVARKLAGWLATARSVMSQIPQPSFVKKATRWFWQKISKPLLFWWKLTIRVGTFNVLFTTFLVSKLVFFLGRQSWIPAVVKQKLGPPLEKLYVYTVHKSRRDNETINRLNLIELAIKNMRAKPSRTIVTAGGMALGIGTIVFLVSLGYGVERLVIRRVARLEELRQTDVSIQVGNPARLNDQTLARFDDLGNVEHALPLIGVVGRITFNQSVSDVAVYGVTAEYLRQSAIKPVRGSIFSSDLLANTPDSNSGTTKLVEKTPTNKESITKSSDVFELTTKKPKYKGDIQPVSIAFDPATWVRVRSEPSASGRLLGYTRRVQDQVLGDEVWGYPYEGQPEETATSKGVRLAKWVTGSFPVWKKTECDPAETGCETGGYELVSDNMTGYIAQLGMEVEPNPDIALLNLPEDQTDEDQEQLAQRISVGDIQGTVLGDSITLDELLDEDGNFIEGTDEDLIRLASESGLLIQENTKTVELADTAERQAVVNQALLRVLGVSENSAVGETFDIQFVVTSNLLGSEEEKVESIPSEYTIIGVIPGEEAPFLYVPFIDLRGLGIQNYSQVKLVVDDQNRLAQVRQQVESLGFITNSVVDTVEQIDRLFDTVRVILAGMGVVALSVASLGMFNTLTVSLLERTREVGLMKAMGMKSNEVQDLFLTESMTMGFVGGFFGIFIGFIGGKLLGFLLSIIALSQGAGIIDVSYIPPLFMLVVFVLSVFVGVFTGLYPAYRATKISALDALRYE